MSVSLFTKEASLRKLRAEIVPPSPRPLNLAISSSPRAISMRTLRPKVGAKVSGSGPWSWMVACALVAAAVAFGPDPAHAEVEPESRHYGGWVLASDAAAAGPPAGYSVVRRGFAD